MQKKKNIQKKKPWPTKEVMQQIYDLNLWGGEKGQFYSGRGSHEVMVTHPYIAYVTSFLNSFEDPISVCDLGCGDFNIGKELVKHTSSYIGVDIVANLIAHNKNTFQEARLTFHCLDIAKDKVPSGDCALLRQVLQHLSNNEVQSILDTLNRFKYIILTEHIPQGDFIPNKDIISGQGIRLKKESGIDILAAPFQFKVKAVEEVLSIVLPDNNGRIVTWLYTVF